MKKVIKYESKNGNYFDTEYEANIEDTKDDLYKFMSHNLCSSDNSFDEIFDFIVDNKDTLKDFLEKL